MNQENVLTYVRQFEQILVEDNAEFQDALAAGLYVAAVSANSLGMTKKIFLKNCETLFDHDKKEQMKELQ
jgi:hypothetical protein